VIHVGKTAYFMLVAKKKNKKLTDLVPGFHLSATKKLVGSESG
jgi:hypothetical protein